ncbi:hypothetical protein C5L38_24230 [Streptomyces sp. WAC00288]|uniref:DUF6197 family protein n=1 Tax=unclassified Streptomyces TaxID=2593676 RepID=UPI00078780D1|nr:MULTISPECIES: hypothetical protein [unclassified Streptomyces]AVH97776.1 hypothetical protein C5L38_24230 [Streptomyces sp. WAC00288]KYG56370.1 hypothetical protein AWI43_19865 [Streptomyces sp. WAC04657]
MAAQTLTAPAVPTQELAYEAALLVREIEQYLTARVRTTAHPLVTKTTAELIAEALGTPASAAGPAPVLAPPARALRLLPDWVLSFPLLRQLHGAGRQISVAEHLELTALVIERYGWHHGALRSMSGRRCILGAQAVLFRLGYGDETTAIAAGNRLQVVLAARGISEPYHRWNDAQSRTREEALVLVRAAAAHVRQEAIR